jgi:hypothetical protein
VSITSPGLIQYLQYSVFVDELHHLRYSGSIQKNKMQKIEWNDSYLLGIPEIDNQHKKLLAVANDLYDAASGSAGNYL